MCNQGTRRIDSHVNIFFLSWHAAKSIYSKNLTWDSTPSQHSKQYVNAEVNVLFWFGIFTLQYTLFSIIFCKPWSILAPILRVIFAIPAASSKSEQVFSVAGRVVTLDWNRLAPEMVEVQSATAEKHALCVKNLLALRLILLLLFNIYVLILSSQL